MAGKDHSKSKDHKQDASKDEKENREGTLAAERVQAARLPRKLHDKELYRLQSELMKVQEWVRSERAGS